MTTREVLQALLDGKKVRRRSWSAENYIHLVDNDLVYDIGELVITVDFSDGNWEVYVEPKPKKTVWQWRYKSGSSKRWRINLVLLTEAEAAETFKDDLGYEKMGSAIEVNDD